MLMLCIFSFLEDFYTVTESGAHCPSCVSSRVVSQKKNATTIAVEVKKSQHKYVIGPRGNTLQEILEKTGVSVEIPPSDSSSETVILRGEPDRLGQALTEVYAKVPNVQETQVPNLKIVLRDWK